LQSMLKLFQSFIGKWSFHRDIAHFAPGLGAASMPSAAAGASCTLGNPRSSTSSSSIPTTSTNPFGVERMTVDGQASFTTMTSQDDANSLQYEESGILISNDNAGTPVNQRYIYRYQDDRIHVYFDAVPNDGRLLHSLDFINSNLATGHHWCPPDTYDATYEFVNPHEFHLTYCVQGPKKNYKMTTVFKRRDN
ncbi:hypothetical protein SAMD00019534_122940, partial [Acytostelium subglobosum LB1]|uniref:hypothetical protein n=1 Tax=Acytostelium subglobosum LB1 TaxID=1410327 RepID=UPI0006451690